MSPNDDNPEEMKKWEKKYLWLGYGGYGSGSEPAAFNTVNIRADPGIFDWLLELFGVMEKGKEKPREDRT